MGLKVGECRDSRLLSAAKGEKSSREIAVVAEEQGSSH